MRVDLLSVQPPFSPLEGMIDAAVGQALLGSVTSALLQTSRRVVIVVPSRME